MFYVNLHYVYFTLPAKYAQAVFQPGVTCWDIIWIAVPAATAINCGHNWLIILTGFLHILELLDLHQDDIVPDLFHIAEGDHILLFPSKYPAKAPWPWYDQMGDTSGTRVKFHISHISQPSAVADIDHFFFFKSKIRIVYT